MANETAMTETEKLEEIRLILQTHSEMSPEEGDAANWEQIQASVQFKALEKLLGASFEQYQNSKTPTYKDIRLQKIVDLMGGAYESRKRNGVADAAAQRDWDLAAMTLVRKVLPEERKETPESDERPTLSHAERLRRNKPLFQHAADPQRPAFTRNPSGWEKE